MVSHGFEKRAKSTPKKSLTRLLFRSTLNQLYYVFRKGVNYDAADARLRGSHHFSACRREMRIELSENSQTPREQMMDSDDSRVNSRSAQWTGVLFFWFAAIASAAHPAFFRGEVSLGNGRYYLTLPGGAIFEYYSYLSDTEINHDDLAFESLEDDGQGGLYLYDFASGTLVVDESVEFSVYF
jgi:hypothetical protein